jgi:hypothetical protein
VTLIAPLDAASRVSSSTTCIRLAPYDAPMSPRHRKHRRHGHFCWSCGRMRANEKFSGRGHAQHLCKDCARLGKEELAYRQSMRNLQRSLTWDGRIPREKRRQFQKYLNHENERVRAFATEIETADAWARAKRRLDQDLENFLDDLAAEQGIVPLETDVLGEYDHSDGEEIPV